MAKLDIAELLDKGMDRKGFLKSIGIATIALTGIGVLIRSFMRQPDGDNHSQQELGYGDSPYGGLKL